MKNVGNSGRGRSEGVPKIFRAPICRAHCAVIFAIAQLSCIVIVRCAVCTVSRSTGVNQSLKLTGHTRALKSSRISSCPSQDWISVVPHCRQSQANGFWTSGIAIRCI